MRGSKSSKTRSLNSHNVTAPCALPRFSEKNSLHRRRCLVCRSTNTNVRNARSSLKFYKSYPTPRSRAVPPAEGTFIKLFLLRRVYFLKEADGTSPIMPGRAQRTPTHLQAPKGKGNPPPPKREGPLQKRPLPSPLPPNKILSMTSIFIL